MKTVTAPDGQIITVANPLFAELGGGFLLGLPVSVIMAAVLFGLVALLTRRTALGMLIESVGINPTAARLAGVRARGITLSVYVFVAVCACVAGLMISRTSRGADANNAGLWIELDAILAVVIGGTLLSGGRFSIVGTLVGALVLQTLTTTVYTAGIAPEVTLVFNRHRHHRGLPAAVPADPGAAAASPARRADGLQHLPPDRA